MKTFVFVFALFTLETLTAPSIAQVPVVLTERNVKIEKIIPAVVGTPDFTVTGTPPKRTAKQLKWLEIEVEFAVDGVPFADELTFKFDVKINGKLCPGEITHVNIPKGRDHFTVMYISPRNLERIMDGKLLTETAIENIWVQITKQGQRLAILTLKKPATEIPVNIPQTQGMLTPKSETPFQVLWWDRYEAVKLPAR